MKPSNTESPEEKDVIRQEPDPKGAADYFDPVTGSSVTAGPSHQNTEADRDLEEDLPTKEG